MSKLKTPKDKKTASYAHDGRNAYRENSKSSRKNIPRGKARVRRAERRVVHQALVTVDGERADTLIAESKKQRLQGFKKYPDVRLGEYLDAKGKRKK